MRIALVSCSSAKAANAAPAAELYVSDWFVKARAYAQQSRFDRWFILSAKYGLLDPQRVIEPYDRDLRKCSARGRRLWAACVHDDLADRDLVPSKITILAGALYRRPLVHFLEESGCAVEVPLGNLGIGRQLSWLKAAAA